jgi:hypothetical protein
MGREAPVTRWPWHDPWGGSFMTHTRARIEADHARLMYAEAMMKRAEPQKVN